MEHKMNAEDIIHLFDRAGEDFEDMEQYQYGVSHETDALLRGVAFVTSTLDLIYNNYRNVFGEEPDSRLDRLFGIVMKNFKDDLDTLRRYKEELEIMKWPCFVGLSGDGVEEEYEITLSSERMEMIRHAMRRAAESARLNAIEAFNDPARPVDEVDKLSKEYMTLREAYDWWEQFTVDVYHGDR